MLDAAIEAITAILDPSRLPFLFLGIALGMTIGLLPGLSGTVGMSILLPFIYGMDPYTGMALLIGMAAVVHTGDTFPSVLLGIPGSSGSQATIMDGYPLAKKGQAARALGAAFFVSMIGGIVGAIVLFISIPIARPLIMSFGQPELFMLTLLGLSMVGILASGSPLKGLMVGVVGLVLGSVGGAPAVSEYRYTFDWIYLSNGIPLAVLALGLFAFPEMVDLLSRNKSIANKDAVNIKGSPFTGIKDALKNKWLVFRSAVLGAVVGFIPGLGGSVVDWISYGVAKSTIKDNDFGNGDIRGVIAPESSNNAKEGGSLIPTLLFSIPGSGTTAILLGGFILLGIETGPAMLTDNLSVTLTIIWTLVLANIFGALACLLLSKPISKLSLINAKVLVPFLLILLIVGAYQSTRHMGDLYLFIGIGLLGWVMKYLDWPRAPLLIGFVLATGAERYLWLSIERYGAEWMLTPSVIAIAVVIVLLLTAGFKMKKTGEKASQEGGS